MLELYLDTADIREVKRLNAFLPLRGVTTNPTILAKGGAGLNRILPELADAIGPGARFHVQVVGESADDMAAEARRIAELPYDIVVKAPATEAGLAAIRKIKSENIPVLATAVYGASQGFIAALNGADYLAPYVNRIDGMGGDGVKVTEELQLLIERHRLDCKLLPASFKNARQALEVLKLGVAAITLPVDIADQMIGHPAAQPAVDRFLEDWQGVFGEKLSYES
ncbi:MAG: fructose-6-phosphate aldolase [Gammaproteobacteria bacterium]